MPGKNTTLHFSIVDSLKDIPQESWVSLFGQDVAEDYGYQKTLEESGLKEFSFGYLVGKRDGSPVAILPFFATVFSFTTLIQGPLQKLILKVQKLFPNFLKLKILFIGSPTTEEFYLGLSKEEGLDLVLDVALKRIHEFCKKEGIGTFLFYNISGKNRPLLEYLAKNGFAEMQNFPTTLIKINASSLEEYIGRLGPSTRKDLRRRLKKSASLVNLKTEVCQDIGQISERVYELYSNNFNLSDIHFEVLTPEFFKKICLNMPGVAKLFITKNKERIVAFNLCLVKGNICIDKFIGFDRQVAHKYQLYYTTFCHNIDWCIKNGIQFYQPGATDYHPKIRLGAKLISLYIMAKSFNPVLNLSLRLIMGWIQPNNFDPVLKNIKGQKEKLYYNG